MIKFMSMLIKWYHWYKIHVWFAEALYTQLQNRHSVCVVICLKCTLRTTRRYSTNWKLNTLAESNKTGSSEWAVDTVHSFTIHTYMHLKASNFIKRVHHHFTDSNDKLIRKERKMHTRKTTDVWFTYQYYDNLTYITWSWQWQSRNTEWQVTCYKKSPQRQKSNNLCGDMIPGKSCSPETSAPERAAIN